VLAQIDVLVRAGPALRLPVKGLLVCTQKDEIWSGLRWGAEWRRVKVRQASCQQPPACSRWNVRSASAGEALQFRRQQQDDDYRHF